jgi:putative ABC transport system permease protein
MAVTFTEPRTMAAFHDLAGREGVVEAEALPDGERPV